MGKFRKAISVRLPVGDLGISTKGCPPVISKIDESSIIKDTVKEGFVVEKVVFEDDGTSISGMTNIRLAEILSKTKNVPNRVLICKERLQSNMKRLPPSVKLGITFKGTPPIITAVAQDSCMRHKLRTGYIIQSMTLGKKNAIEFRELSSAKLADLLDTFFDEKYRRLHVEIPPPSYLAKVYLPPTGPLGIAFNNNPPCITQVFDDSPLYGKVQVGTIVESVTLVDGKYNYPRDANLQDDGSNPILSTKQLAHLLKETAGEPGRVLRFVMPCSSNTLNGRTDTKRDGIRVSQHYEGRMGAIENANVYLKPSHVESTNAYRGFEFHPHQHNHDNMPVKHSMSAAIKASKFLHVARLGKKSGDDDEDDYAPSDMTGEGYNGDDDDGDNDAKGKDGDNGSQFAAMTLTSVGPDVAAPNDTTNPTDIPTQAHDDDYNCALSEKTGEEYNGDDEHDGDNGKGEGGDTSSRFATFVPALVVSDVAITIDVTNPTDRPTPAPIDTTNPTYEKNICPPARGPPTKAPIHYPVDYTTPAPTPAPMTVPSVAASELLSPVPSYQPSPSSPPSHVPLDTPSISGNASSLPLSEPTIERQNGANVNIFAPVGCRLPVEGRASNPIAPIAKDTFSTELSVPSPSSPTTSITNLSPSPAPPLNSPLISQVSTGVSLSSTPSTITSNVPSQKPSISIQPVANKPSLHIIME